MINSTIKNTNSATPSPPTKRRQTTVRSGGKRFLVTTTAKGVTTVKPATPEEFELQAAQIAALKRLPEYACTAKEAGRGKFTFAGDQNAAKRGPKARSQALKAGLTAGEHDVRLYMWPVWSEHGGVLGLVENKVGRASLEPSQEARHPLLEALGFTRQKVVRATTCEDAAAQAVALVTGWLSANDNTPAASDKKLA